MKYSFNILAAALAVGLFTLPAYAAVSDVEGGEIHVNTTINKHYNEYSYRQNKAFFLPKLFDKFIY